MIPFSNYYQRSGSSWFKTALYLLVFVGLHTTLVAQAPTCGAKAGLLNKTSVCFLGNQTLLKATNRDTSLPTGFRVVYLLTHHNAADTALVIEQIANEPTFVLPAAPQGTYTIHTLVYNPTTLQLSNITLNQTTLRQLSNTLGNTCSALDLTGDSVQFGACDTRCNATAGRLLAQTPTCVPSGGEVRIRATMQSTPLIPTGFHRLYALVNSTSGELLRFDTIPVFGVNLAGRYSIHTLVYDTATLNLDRVFEQGIVTLRSIDTLLIQGGGNICGALDKVGASFSVEACPPPTPPCQVKAGTLALSNNPCVKDSSVTIVAVTRDTSIVPTGARVRYLLSTGTGKVVQRVDSLPRFTVRDTGLYTIHTIVYHPDSFRIDSLAFGRVRVATIDSLLSAKCGDVDVTGAVFEVKSCPPAICSANTGVLVPGDSICLFNGRATLKGEQTVAPLAPFGFRTAYLLSAGDSLRVEQVGTSPIFNVNRAGRFRIHTLVYDTVQIKLDSIRVRSTPIGVINDLLLQGGGTICGALDTVGAIFDLQVCADCPASAGRLTSNTDPCLKDSTVTLTVYNSEAPVVPPGFKLVYLLSEGSTQVITQLSDTASFVVDTLGVYAFHTLVYDFSVFKLDSIRLGVTTINTLNKHFIQGGGTQCGALDTKGFSFLILPCPIVCDAKVGTLKFFNQTCVSNQSGLIEARVDRPSVVPTGYQVRYLLSVTDLQIIRQISTTPSFRVPASGEYSIHTLVYDPAALNLSDIQINITSIDQVNSWLLINGGDACGALDTRGLLFNIEDCDDTCFLNTGQLGASNTFVCVTNGSATLSAFTLFAPFTSAGYQVKYLLSFGNNGVIQQTSDNPVFRVNQTGRFTIHTLVYNPNTLSLNTIILGSTNINDFNQQLIQGGGSICAALDLTGLSFQVGLCAGSEATGLRAYPNPSTQKVNVQLPDKEVVNQTTLELVNVNGDVTKTWQVDGYTDNLYLDISDQQPGVYYLRVYYDGTFVQQTSVIRAQ